MTVKTSIDAILVREGPIYKNDPNDKGGPTKWGITLPVLSHYFGRPATIEDLKALREDTAYEVYLAEFVRDPGYGAIANPALLGLIVDSAVQHSPLRTTEWLQTALGTKPDGDLGPVTRAALTTANVPRVYREVLATRLVFYGEIVEEDPTQAEWIHGWMRRMRFFVVNCPGG